MFVFGQQPDEQDAANQGNQFQNEELDRTIKAGKRQGPVHGFHQDDMDEVDPEGDFGKF